MQRARQLASRFLPKDSIPLLAVIAPADVSETTPQDIQPPLLTTPVETTALASHTTGPTPAPSNFTISYTPLSISYPDSTSSSAPLPTDAVRVTKHELEAMLHQSYLHGSEHGWKATGQQQLQAKYDNDIRAAVSKLDTTVAQIRQRGFDCGFKEGKIQLKARYEKQQLDTLHNFAERAQEITEQDFNRGFNDGRDAGIQEEVERRESTRAELADCGMQTEPPQHKQSFSVNFSMQTEPPEPEHILRINFGTQTEPPEPASSVASPELLPIAAASSDRGLEPPSMPSLSPSTCSRHHDFDASASSIDSIPIPVSKNHPLSSKSLITAATASSEPHMPDSKPLAHFVLPPPLISSSSSPTLPDAQPRNATPFAWSDEPADAPALLPLPLTSFPAPTISTSFPRRDLSGLRPSANPWQSLQHRKGCDRRRSTQPGIQHHRARPRCGSAIWPARRLDSLRSYQ